MNTLKIVVIDDDLRGIHKIRNELPSKFNWDFQYFTNFKEFKYWNEINRHIDVAIVDLNLGSGFENGGLGIAESIRKKYPNCLVIIFSSSILTPSVSFFLNKMGIEFISKRNVRDLNNIEALIDSLKKIDSTKISEIENENSSKNVHFNKSVLAMIAGLNHELRNVLVRIKQESFDLKNIIIKSEILESKKFEINYVNRNLDNYLKRCIEILDLMTFDKKVKNCSINSSILKSSEYFDLESHGVELKLFDIEQEYLIQGTETELNLIFFNLISNSIKALEERRFGDRKIFIKIDKDKHSPFINIQFHDNGVGIDPEHIHDDRIFQEGFSSYKFGQGIGLSIVKQIVEEAYNGKISARSEKGKGTTIKLALGITGHNSM